MRAVASVLRSRRNVPAPGSPAEVLCIAWLRADAAPEARRMEDMTVLAQRWTRLVAPSTGDTRTELLAEAAEFLGIPLDEARRRLTGAGERFTHEWVAS